MRAFVYWWDFVRGGEASVIPPEAAVAEPLRRLFVLQFGVLAGALLVYWVLDSSVTGLAVLLVAKTAADVVLAVLERLRAARIKAAVAAGVAPTAGRRPPQPTPRGAGASVAADRRRSCLDRRSSHTISRYHDAICEAVALSGWYALSSPEAGS